MQKGDVCSTMDIFISYIIAVLAEITAYYLCKKWFGSNDSDDTWNRKKKPPVVTATGGFVFVQMNILFLSLRVF